MAGKAKSEIVRLVSSAGTGHFYTTRVPRGTKLEGRKKYDPKARKHVEYNQKKIK